MIAMFSPRIILSCVKNAFIDCAQPVIIING